MRTVTDAGSLRVGHEERERLVHVLMQQYAEGRRTAAEVDDLSGRGRPARPYSDPRRVVAGPPVPELADRPAGARQARTYSALDGLVADLPVPPPSTAARLTATTANLARLGTDAEHRQTMTGGMSSYVRRGVWTVPAYLNLNA